MKKALYLAISCALLAASCGKKAPEILTDQQIADIINTVKNTPSVPVEDGETAVLETNFGTMKVEFLTEKAPNHCANFKRLANAGFYDGTQFHRVIKDFMIQGGDILTRDANPGNNGTGRPGYTIDAEFNDIRHVPGILSMARSQHPNSAGSQFFIMHGTSPGLDGSYTAFGKVIEGMDVLEKIANVEVTASPSGENSLPVEPVYLYSVKIVK